MIWFQGFYLHMDNCCCSVCVCVCVCSIEWLCSPQLHQPLQTAEPRVSAAHGVTPPPSSLTHCMIPETVSHHSQLLIQTNKNRHLLHKVPTMCAAFTQTYKLINTSAQNSRDPTFLTLQSTASHPSKKGKESTYVYMFCMSVCPSRGVKSVHQIAFNLGRCVSDDPRMCAVNFWCSLDTRGIR